MMISRILIAFIFMTQIAAATDLDERLFFDMHDVVYGDRMKKKAAYMMKFFLNDALIQEQDELILKECMDFAFNSDLSQEERLKSMVKIARYLHENRAPEWLWTWDIRDFESSQPIKDFFKNLLNLRGGPSHLTNGGEEEYEEKEERIYRGIIPGEEIHIIPGEKYYRAWFVFIGVDNADTCETVFGHKKYDLGGGNYFSCYNDRSGDLHCLNLRIWIHQ